MKIAFIIDLWTPVIGGSQTHVRELSHRLTKDYGYTIDIYTRALIDQDNSVYLENESLCNGRLHIKRIGPVTRHKSFLGRLATLFTIPICIYKAHKKDNYDLIHAHSTLGGLMGKFTSTLINKPIVFTVHGSPNIDRGKSLFDYYVEKYILTKIQYNKIISVGQQYPKYKNVNKEIAIIPNGVDTEIFKASPAPPKPSFFKMLFVGRLDWVKGIDTLIDTIKILKGRDDILITAEKLQVHLVGYGFEEESLKKKVARTNLSDIIIFRGKLLEENLIKEYKSSHIFIIPSLCEGQPITILEAMAAGLPVLATNPADASSIVTPDVGWHVEAGNPHLLAAKLSEIIHCDLAELAEMGKRGHKKIVSNFSLTEMVNRTMQIYQNQSRQL